MAKTINFFPAHGLDSYTGYGRMELGIASGLQSVGVTTLLYPERQYPMLMVNSSLDLLRAPHTRHARVWAFNMIETNKVDPSWVDAINSVCERILVPCPPMIEIYRQSGVSVPVDYIPLGVDLFGIQNVDEPLTGKEIPFNFLTYSYGDVRKGADVAVRAFERAFEGDRRFRLIIKAREGYQETWLSQLDNPQIELVIGRQSEADWLALQHRSHCFVFPSRGEGWGMPPRELTLAGVPTIATQWLGMWDVEQWGIPLHVKSMQRCTFKDYQANAVDGLWAEPDEDDLITRMQWVVHNYAEACAIARKGRDYLLDNFRWLHIGQRLSTLIEQYG